MPSNAEQCRAMPSNAKQCQAMPSNANASARVLHHKVDGSTLAQLYRSATKHLSRDQLVKSLLVIKAVLDQSLVNIFAWEPDLGKLRK